VKRALCVVCLLVLSLAVSSAPAPAGARPEFDSSEVRVFGIQQHDLDGDGRPDLTVIDCAFATERDRVYVYDGAGDMRAANRWEDAVDFQNDIWLFDVGATGRFALALVFTREDGRDVAYLYDDQDGDGRVKVAISGKRVAIEESPYWTAKIESDSTWLLPDGSINHNLLLTIDGPLYEHLFPRDLVRQYRTNGVPKWEAGVVDSDHDGIPEYSYTRLLAPSPADWALPRAGMSVNVGRTRPSRPEGFVFWPLLNGAEWYQQRNYYDTPYHITYDFRRRKLIAAASNGYPIERGFHINNFQYFSRDRINYPDFEAPMAYYDLANDRDGLPELHIRVAYYPKGDVYLLFRPIPQSIEEITYSWNQRNTPNLTWNYKLGLLGRHHIDSVVQIGDFQVNLVPYDELPTWVVSRPWDVVTFVAEEGGAYASSEGIYEWAPLEHVQNAGEYIIGNDTTPPGAAFTSIREGFRAEYGEINDEVRLYFSPIDRRLHLWRAEFGLWNLGDGRELRYETLDGAAIGAWSLREGVQTVRTLWHAAGQLVLADATGVRLRSVTVPRVLFWARAPTNHDEWAELKALLERHQGTFAGDDPAAMFNQFTGPVATLAEARVRDLRLADDGFRFVVDLPSGGAADVPWSAGLAPGTYVVTYHPDGGYSAVPGTPPDLELLALTVVGDPPAALFPVELLARVRNHGTEDARAVALRFSATRAGYPAVPVTGGPVDVRAGETRDIRLTWSPPAGGRWTLEAIPPGYQLTAAPTEIAVSETPEAGVRDLLIVQRLGEQGGVILMSLLLAAVGLVGALGLSLLSSRGAA